MAGFPPVVYAVPAYVPPAVRVDRRPLELVWTGWDGSVWDLRDWRSGVFVTGQDVLGLHWPPFEVQTSSSPGRAGRRRLDVRVQERPVGFSVHLYSDAGTPAWLDRFRAFMRSFHPLRAGTLTARTPSSTRTIELYLDSDGGYAYQRDPAFVGWGQFPLTLTAEDPYWLGAPITGSWEQVVTAEFFAGGNLNISSSAALELAAITNPGDAAVWPKWVVTSRSGTVTATVTVDGGEIGLPAIPSGQTAVLDTDPAVGTVELDGVDVSGLADPWDPRPIPAGGEVPLLLEMVGDGTVEVSIRPRYLLAF